MIKIDILVYEILVESDEGEIREFTEPLQPPSPMIKTSYLKM